MNREWLFRACSSGEMLLAVTELAQRWRTCARCGRQGDAASGRFELVRYATGNDRFLRSPDGWVDVNRTLRIWLCRSSQLGGKRA